MSTVATMRRLAALVGEDVVEPLTTNEMYVKVWTRVVVGAVSLATILFAGAVACNSQDLQNAREKGLVWVPQASGHWAKARCE